MNITQLAQAALSDHHIDTFLVTESDWTGQKTKTPVEVLPTLMDCVLRSCALAVQGKVGWILNPNPFDKITVRPAFDAGEVMPV